MPSVQKMIKHISKNLQRFLQDFEYVFYDRDCCKATFTTFLPCRFYENVSSMNIFLEKFRHSRNSQFFLHNMRNIIFLTYRLSVTAKSPSAKSSTQVIMC